MATLTELADTLGALPQVLKSTRSMITAAGLDDVRPKIQKRAIDLARKMLEVEAEMAELFADAKKPSTSDSVRSRLKVGEGCVIVQAGGGPADKGRTWPDGVEGSGDG